MQTVLLLTDPVITFHDLHRRIRERWPSVYSIDGSRLGLMEGDWNLFIDQYDDLLDEYEPEVREKIRKLIPAPQCYGIVFSLTHTNGGEFARRFLMTLVDDEKIVVDNDHGLLMRGPAFVRRLKAEPSWDWVNTRESGEESL